MYVHACVWEEQEPRVCVSPPGEHPQHQPQPRVGVQAEGHLTGRVQLSHVLVRTAHAEDGRVRHLVCVHTAHVWVGPDSKHRP